MKIHPRLACGLIGLTIGIILLIIEKIVGINIFSKHWILIIIIIVAILFFVYDFFAKRYDEEWDDTKDNEPDK